MEDIRSDHELDTKVSGDTPVQGFETNGAPSDDVAPFGEASVMDLLKADYEELSESRETFIQVKGYERAGLQILYHLPENGKELDGIARKVQREFKDSYSRNLNTAIDTMIYLCSGLYVQPTGIEKPVTLDPDHDEVPVQFDEKLAELLGFEGQVTSARQVVRKLFANNDMMIIAHAEKLNRWLQNTKADLSLEVWQLGE